jgi:hypothetical protein
MKGIAPYLVDQNTATLSNNNLMLKVILDILIIDQR